MKKLLVFILLAMAIVLTFSACGDEVDTNNEGDKDNGTDSRTETAVRMPQGDTAAEKLCWLMNDLSYTQIDGEEGVAYLQNMISSLNQGGATITYEQVEKLFEEIEGWYGFERNGSTSFFAELSNEGIDAYADMHNKSSDTLEKEGRLYGDCLVLVDPDVIEMIDAYLLNEPPVRVVYKSANGSLGLEYELSTDGTYYIVTGIGECADRDIVIPDVYNEKPVRMIDRIAFNRNEQITSVKLSGNVEMIRTSAFSDCKNLLKVTLAKGNIAFRYGFYGTHLVEIYNLSGIDISGEYYSSLTEYALDIYSTNEQSKVNITNDGFAFYENGKDVRLIAYVGDKTELTLPQDYNGKEYTINQYAFAYNHDLTSVILPNNVKEIGNRAFCYCINLNEVIIPDSVETVGIDAFKSVGKIYCRAESKPNGWNEQWCDEPEDVEWGYQE